MLAIDTDSYFFLCGMVELFYFLSVVLFDLICISRHGLVELKKECLPTHQMQHFVRLQMIHHSCFVSSSIQHNLDTCTNFKFEKSGHMFFHLTFNVA